jgi:hypothetical protein
MNMPKKRIHRPAKRMKYLEEFVDSDGLVRLELLLSHEQKNMLSEHLGLFFSEGKRCFQERGRGVVDVDFCTPSWPVSYRVESDYNAKYLPKIQPAIQTYDPVTQIVLRIQFVLPPDIHSPRANRIASVWNIFTQPENRT